MASIPHYDKAVPGTDRAKHVTVDRFGFREVHDVGQPFDEWVVGASYFAAGTTNEQTISGQLERFTGRPVRNLAWPGGGPARTVQVIVENGFSNFGSKPRTLIWGIAQRAASVSHFNLLHSRLDASGALREPNLRVRAREVARRYLHWPQRVLQPFLNETSDLRHEARRFARFVPPTAVDAGWTSRVKLADYRGRSMVFLDDSIKSAFRSYEARGGDVVVETVSRVKKWLEQQGVDLLVVLVPDKYEIFRADLVPDLKPPGTEPLEQPITETFASELARQGVRVVDLRPVLLAEQDRRGASELMTYRADDTHWSDHGIRIAAEAIAASLGSSSSSVKSTIESE
jgi:hypothetical protein